VPAPPGAATPAAPVATPQGAESTSPAAPVSEQTPAPAGDQRKTTTEARDLESRRSPIEKVKQPENALRLAMVASGSLAVACIVAALLLRHRLRSAPARGAEPGV
jgi:hypothetical protein